MSKTQIITLFILLVSIIGNLAEAKESNAPKANTMTPGSILEISASMIDKYVESGWFSGNILVGSANSKRASVQQSYGYADIAEQIPNQACTRFNVGSIAKIYTAVLVLQYIEKGTFSLDTSIAETGVNIGIDPDIAKNVTIGHLLKHKAGFSDIFIPDYMDDPLKFDTLTKKIALLRHKPLLFEPGTDQRYSNYGYILLGAVLEGLSGKSFGTLLRDNIYDVVNAKTASLHRLDGNKCQSERYVFSLEQTLELTDFREVSGPDGGIEATVDDVHAFFHTLFFTDKLLTRQGEPFSWYFGENSHFGAYGGGTGVSAAVEVLRDQEIIVVALANSDELVAERISNRMVALALHNDVAPFALPPKHFVYQQYRALGAEGFKANFAQVYKQHGYSSFMGKAINEAGLSLARAGMTEASLEVIGFLSHFYPTAPQAYDSLAYVYYLQGDAKRAQAAFNQALSFSSDFNSDYHANNYRTEGQADK